MNDIEKMIESLCPDGVEFRELGAVCNIHKGKQLNKTELREEGKYPAYNGGKTFSGWTDKYNVKENTIIISQGGASAGFVNFIKTKFWANAHCYYLLPQGEIISNRYLYHLLKSKETEFMTSQHGAGIPALALSKLERLQIPLPPLEIQQKIVKVLDIFTELEATLEAELALRKKQYEYYRNKLLTFDNITDRGGYGRNPILQRLAALCPQGMPMVALGEVGTFIRGSGLQKKDFVENGVGCIHYGQIYTYYGTFTDKTKSFVSEEFAKKAKMASFGDLVMATTSENVGDVCKVVAWLGKESIAISGDALIIKHNQNSKYMAYLFQTKHFLDFKKMYATGTKVIRVSTDNLKKYKFYLPPLEIQKMIVEILDKFDRLVNDLTTGLPAEINARRQQYEYYRERLLSFNKK